MLLLPLPSNLPSPISPFSAMDASLSASIPPLNNIPTRHQKSLLPLHQYFKTLISKPKTNSMPLSNKAGTPVATRKTSFLHPLPFPESFQAPPPSIKRPSKHRELLHDSKPSTGYAVALLDAARSDGVVEVVKRDAERLSRWLSNEQLRCVIADPFVGSEEKVRIVKEVVKKGGFHRHLVKLVSLLVERRKIGILSQVVMEFVRIYHLLSGSNTATQVVLVSSEVKMGKNQMMGIAKTIQNLTGAEQVKVRQLASQR